MRRLQYSAPAVTAIRGDTTNASGYMTAPSRSTPRIPRSIPLVTPQQVQDLLTLAGTPAAAAGAGPSFISQYDGYF